jgi:hypothetical protein
MRLRRNLTLPVEKVGIDSSLSTTYASSRDYL